MSRKSGFNSCWQFYYSYNIPFSNGSFHNLWFMVYDLSIKCTHECTLFIIAYETMPKKKKYRQSSFDDLIHDPIFFRFIGAHEIVAVDVFFNS